MPQLPKKLLIATAQKQCQEAIMSVVRQHFSEAELYQANTVNQAIEQLTNQTINLMMLDLELPDSQGLESLKLIREQFPQTELVILANEENKELASQAMAQGAAGFILNGLPLEQLSDALEQILEGQLYQSS